MKSSERPRSVTSSPPTRGVGAVGVHRPGEGLPALGDLLRQGAVVETLPVAVAEHLVLGVHGRDGVLEVHDRGDRGLQQQVLDPGGVGGADRVLGVDLDLDVQPVVDQQDRLGLLLAAAEADQLGRVGEPDDVVLDRHGETLAVHGVRRGVGVRPGGQREVLVEEGPATGDDLVAAGLVVVVAGGQVAVLRDHVGAVERVVERAPAGVHRVGREPGVEQRDDELRTGDARHLVVDVGRGRRHLVRLVQQVADLAQEGGVGTGLGLAGVLAVPVVELGLELVPAGEQLPVAGREVVHDRVHALPEGRRLDAGTRQGLLLDEPVKALGDAESADLNALAHITPWTAFSAWWNRCDIRHRPLRSLTPCQGR